MTARPLLRRLPAPDRAAILASFVERFADDYASLVTLAASATRTPMRHHEGDHGHALDALAALLAGVAAPRGCWYRPCGRVLLGLSANEPLIVGVVPVAAALLAGNRVALRPATSNRAVAARIATLLAEAGLPDGALRMVSADRAAVAAEIATSDHVVWFGSSDVCARVAADAAAAQATTVLDAEGYDLAVFDETASGAELDQWATWIVESIARHDGQTCQAIRGVLAHASVVDAVTAALARAIDAVRVGAHDDPTIDATTRPRLTRRDAVPAGEPAPFAPVAWIAAYRDDVDLAAALAAHPWGLSLAVYSRRPWRELAAVAASRVGRVVVNAHPHDVDPALPWGGYRRSGSTGPQRWLTKFADLVVGPDATAEVTP